jgi:gluconolactonase
MDREPSSPGFGIDSMQSTFFFPADAHEGPVWVDNQRRLYYATSTHLEGRRRVAIEYLDFGPLGKDDLWKSLTNTPGFLPNPQTFLPDANMANGMQLEADQLTLLVAEQGYGQKLAAVSNIGLTTGVRCVLVDNYQGVPFNSINKVIRSRRGHLIFSDPDYGFRQDFKPPSELEPNVYIKTAQGALNCFRCGLQMPHGLALSPDERTLFISDTSNEGAHRPEIKLNRRKSVWKYSFDPETGQINGPGKCCFAVDQGVPDGMLTTGQHLLVGGGDGVYVADLMGQLRGKISTPNNAVNLTLAGAGKHLFVTIDTGVMLFMNWRTKVEQI